MASSSQEDKRHLHTANCDHGGANLIVTLSPTLSLDRGEERLKIREFFEEMNCPVKACNTVLQKV